MEFFKQIVLKRASPNLFDESVLEKLALCSGGVVFDYLRMVRECCIRAKVDSLEKINENMALIAFGKLVDVFSRIISSEYYDKLAEVYNKNDTDPDELLSFLLHMNAILEYDHRKWYDMHPGVYRLLIEKGIKLNKSACDE